MHQDAVFIGRFQPFHNAHLATVRFALQQAEQLIIVIGGDNKPRTTKDPWTSAERIAMIRNCLTPEEQGRCSFVAVKDFLYNDNLWLAEVQRAVKTFSDGKDVVLVGHKKDNSSFYLNLFPQWSFIESNIVEPSIGATKIRTLYFSLDRIGVMKMVAAPVFCAMEVFAKTPEFNRLYKEHQHIQDYKAQWVGAPFPPTFVTVDAVVICSGHVLVVRRKGALGNGLIALPGGFLNTNETIVNGCLRELREETSIKIHVNELRKHIVDERVFDHPTRSLRGRTITHAVYIDLGRGELPPVKGTDDADKAWWMPLAELHAREAEFFEDHAHIVQRFIR